MLINTIKFTYQPMDPTQEDFTLVKDRGFLADDLLQAARNSWGYRGYRSDDYQRVNEFVDMMIIHGLLMILKWELLSYQRVDGFWGYN